MSTIFTKIINKEIPATIVFENEQVIAFKDINPVAPIHILVLPKKEIPTLNDISFEDKELIGEVFLTIAKIAGAVNKVAAQSILLPHDLSLCVVSDVTVRT